MSPSIEERLIDLQQRRIDACKNLPANAEGADDHTRIDSANINLSSPHPTSPTQKIPTTETSEPSIIQNLVDHYSGELPEYESNLEKASDIASDEKEDAPEDTKRKPYTQRRRF